MQKRDLFDRMERYLERHSGRGRRTIFLDGKAVAVALAGALGERVAGVPWYEDQFQRGMVAGEDCGNLVILATREPLDSQRAGAVHITLTTHGLDEAGFKVAREDWWSWWTTQVDSPELSIA
jgi:hypothetical protein